MPQGPGTEPLTPGPGPGGIGMGRGGNPRFLGPRGALGPRALYGWWAGPGGGWVDNGDDTGGTRGTGGAEFEGRAAADLHAARRR